MLLWAMGPTPLPPSSSLTSVVVPLVKILALLWLCYVVQRGRGHLPSASSNSIRMTEFCGALVDDRRLRGVPSLAGLIRLDNLMTIYLALRPSPLPGRTGHHGGCHEFRFPPDLGFTTRRTRTW